MTPQAFATGTLGLTLLVLAIGCTKGSSSARLPVHGKVSLPSGVAINGSITLLPAEGKGIAATTALVDGRFAFDQQNGPTVGPKRVLVHRVLVSSGIVRSQSLEVLLDKKKASKPPTAEKSDWTTTANVLDDGRFQCDLTLER